jgi:hypothetical protein
MVFERSETIAARVEAQSMNQSSLVLPRSVS